MKRKTILALLCVLCLAATPAARALNKEDLLEYAIANGIVESADHVDVLSPFSGTAGVVTLVPGDQVTAGETMLTLLATPLYAGEDAAVMAVYASPGNDAAAVTERYGGILGLEPAQSHMIGATTAGAYNDVKNRTIHLGELLFFQSAKKDKPKGEGLVVDIRGKAFRVEITKGEMESGEVLTLYRSDSYTNSNSVGKGTVVRRDPLMVPASGRIINIHVVRGDTVVAGQLLAEVVAADAPPDATPVISAPKAGVVSQVAVMSGQMVGRGQLLFRLEDPSTLKVVAQVDEVDLCGLQVGDRLPLTLDTDESDILVGTVTHISALGTPRQNASYFAVHVSLPAGKGLMGGSASVYLPKQ